MCFRWGFEIDLICCLISCSGYVEVDIVCKQELKQKQMLGMETETAM